MFGNAFSFEELMTSSGLKRLDEDFLHYLSERDTVLLDKLIIYRTKDEQDLENKSDFLIKLSMQLECFLMSLFDINKTIQGLKHINKDNDEIFSFKSYYVQKLAMKKMRKVDVGNFPKLNHWLSHELEMHFPDLTDLELAVSKLGILYLKNEQQHQDQIQALADWCACLLKDKDLDSSKKTWVLFSLPLPIDPDNLIDLQSFQDLKIAKPENLRYRDGFKLTDAGMGERQVQNEIHNCMFCHKHDGDYCSKGFPLEKNSPEYAKNTFNDFLTGCPLGVKISEMLWLKKEGHVIASLAMLMRDNPMCLLTGYRVCNDCMKSCIYQKQEPVHVPQVESKIVKEVLNLPWGFELYDLLTRWNPLHSLEWHMQPYNGKKVLIIGAGPAGITMAHYLLNHGCVVVMMDGLKIEPLPKEYLTCPIKDYQQLREPLDKKITWGFGGVAEYGITVRWDKNFLKLAYISLQRKQNFKVLGGVRFGGSITIEEAWQQGFDHTIIAVGAGLPKELPIPGSLAPGMRQANDFLMALHLTGINKQNTVIDYQVRLPAVVIGGGLTAVDTATEVQAYYINQVEKVLVKYEELSLAGISLEQNIPKKELNIVYEMVKHGIQIREERKRAEALSQNPNFIQLLKSWGGVTIVYRKTLHESPAYRRNHEELKKAFEEGIKYRENLVIDAAILDQNGHIGALRVRNACTKEILELEARSVFIATGTRPNIAYAFEHRNTFEKNEFGYGGFEYQEGKLHSVKIPIHVKADNFGPFTSYNKENKKVTYIGDAHPLFQGNVVNAMASAMRTFPHVKRVLDEISFKDRKNNCPNAFLKKLECLYSCEVIELYKINPKEIRLVICAPQAAKMFKPGQFYRLQLYETTLHQKKINKQYLSKAFSFFPCNVNKETGIIEFNISVDTFLASAWLHIKPKDNIALMGPAGASLSVPKNETILVLGDEISLEIMPILGPEFKNNNNKLIYIVSLNKKDKHWKECEQYSDKFILWDGEEATILKSLENNKDTVELMAHTNRVIVFGKSNFAKKMNPLLEGTLNHIFLTKPTCYSSVIGPMQCMLKGVCGQCLQWQIDPITKLRTKAVFACSWQCQPSEYIDFDHLEQRTAQNSALESIQELWFNHCALEPKAKGTITDLICGEH